MRYPRAVRGVCLSLLVLLAACQGDGASEPAPGPQPAPVESPAAPAAPAVPAGPVRILALGDSYTIGHGAPERDRWPVQLAALLRAEGRQVADPRIIARTGWTAAELLDAFEAERPAGPFELVTLLVGVNDQYRGRDVERHFLPPFRELLARAAGLAGAADRVVVVSIPDWGVTAFARGQDGPAIAREIDAFNQAARAEAGKVGARWVDVTGLSRRAGADRRYLVRDGLHPSGEAYAEWAREVLPAALEALGRR